MVGFGEMVTRAVARKVESARICRLRLQIMDLPARRICGSATDLIRDGLVLQAVGIIPPRARKGKEKN